MKFTELGKSYWNENGVYNNEYHELYKKLVPDMGEAETIEGELIRSVSRLYWDYFNNGNCNVREEIFHTCSHCSGYGEVETVYDIDDEGNDIIEYETCPECDGDGEVLERVIISDYYKHFFDLIKEEVVEARPTLSEIENEIKGDNEEFGNMYETLVDYVVFHVWNRVK